MGEASSAGDWRAPTALRRATDHHVGPGGAVYRAPGPLKWEARFCESGYADNDQCPAILATGPDAVHVIAVEVAVGSAGAISIPLTDAPAVTPAAKFDASGGRALADWTFLVRFHRLDDLLKRLESEGFQRKVSRLTLLLGLGDPAADAAKSAGSEIIEARLGDGKDASESGLAALAQRLLEFLRPNGLVRLVLPASSAAQSRTTLIDSLNKALRNRVQCEAVPPWAGDLGSAQASSTDLAFVLASTLPFRSAG